MARSGTQVVEVVKSEGLDRVVAASASKLLVLAWPWAMLPFMAIIAAISHWKFGAPPAVTWSVMVCSLGTFTLTALTWLVSHQRGTLGRCHSTATTLCGGLWFTIATINGVTNLFTAGALFFGGLIVCVGWNIRAVIREAGPGEGGHVDPLARLFDQAKSSFGLGGARVRTREVTDHKIKGELELPAGEKIADDAIKKAPYVESGLELPPGSVQFAPDENNAARAHVTITDPRIMNSPIPWPGASRPGGCITEPLRVGVFADAEPVEPVVTRNHIQIMGASGSGKSMGGAWNLTAEMITRRNVAFFGVDLAKADQTLGPLRPAMHRLETTKAGASKFIRDLHAAIPLRTKWLADHGYNDWESGCGLAFWIVLFEEVAKAFDILGQKDQEKIEQITKEIRSAGGRVIMSLQRSTYGEMPTIVRSQMAFMCFGLTSADDTSVGLSERQQRAEASPELWGAGNLDHVGKAFIDAAGIPSSHIAMPLRTYQWGKTAREASARMKAHAAEWPAGEKEVDMFTAQLADPAIYGGRQPRIAAAADQGSESDAAARTAAALDSGARPAVEAPREALRDAAPAARLDADRLGDAAELVIREGRASVELLARGLDMAPAEAAQVLEALERRGIVGPEPEDGGRRTVLVSDEDEAEDAVDDLREDGDAVSEYVRTDDPSPDMQARPDDAIEDIEGDELEAPGPDDDRELSPAAARRLVEDWLRHRAKAGALTFTAGDEEFGRIREAAGRKRGWGYKVLNEMVDSGVLEKDDEGSSTVFKIVDLDALDDGPPVSA